MTLRIWLGALLAMALSCGAVPYRAQAHGPALIDSSYRLSAHRTADSVQVRIHWGRKERDRADLALELLDMQGDVRHTWRQRLRLASGTDAVAAFALAPVRALGLDSTQFYFVVSANLSCNCEDLHRVVLPAAADDYDWPDPQLHLSVRRHNKRQFVVLEAQNLAKDVQLSFAKPHPHWRIEEPTVDVLPGQEQEIEVLGLAPTDLLKPEDVEAEWRR